MERNWFQLMLKTMEIARQRLPISVSSTTLLLLPAFVKERTTRFSFAIQVLRNRCLLHSSREQSGAGWVNKRKRLKNYHVTEFSFVSYIILIARNQRFAASSFEACPNTSVEGTLFHSRCAALKKSPSPLRYASENRRGVNYRDE